MKLQPILEDLKEVIASKGRYEVQLEIPRSSTLTNHDIEKIMRLSTWSVNPSQEAVDYEGIRSVLVNRESAIRKGRVELKGLQISGIGHRKFDMSKVIQDDSDKSFYPPIQENFMDHTVGTKMSTSYACGKQVITTKPKYRALGTYTQTELKDKLTKTMSASTLKLEKIAISHVEAYGRYLDSELQGKDGSFGFMVFPIPDAKKQRVASEVLKNFSMLSKKIGSDPRGAIMAYYYGTTPYISALTDGLRELHDKGRVVHLQPHLSNFYLVKGTPYVMDWATMRNLGKDKEENIINRTIDITRPATDYNTIFSSIFPHAPDKLKTEMGYLVKEVVLEVYSKQYGKEINFKSLAKRATNVLGKDATEFDIVVQWMKDEGLEEFPKYVTT